MNTIRQYATLWLVALIVAGFAAPAAAQPDASTDTPDEHRIRLLQAKPRAYAIVEATAGNKQARVRLAGLEAAQHAPDAADDLALAGLTDENPAVRFAALVTIGKLKINRLADAAVDLMRDEDESVRAAAIFAVKRNGRDVDLSPLGRMLATGKPGARANAALLLGELGDPQAIEMLREMAGAPMPRVSSAQRAWVRLQFAEAMIKLDPNDAEVLGTIRAAMFSPLDDVRVLSMQILGEVGDEAVRNGLKHVLERDNPIQVRIAAAQALVRMGDNTAAPTLMDASAYDVEALRDDLEDFLRDRGRQDVGPETRAVREMLADEKQLRRNAAEVRAQAAVALGWVRSPRAVDRLIGLMEDPDPIVSVAAASAVLRASR